MGERKDEGEETNCRTTTSCCSAATEPMATAATTRVVETRMLDGEGEG